MLRSTSIFGGTAALTASSATSTLIRGLAALVLVRYLGAADYGALAAALALGALACYLVDLGTGYQALRAISQTPQRAPEHLGNALLVTALTLVVAVLVLNLAVWAFDYPAGARALMPVLGLGVLLQAARAPLNACLRALGQMGKAALVDVSTAVVLGVVCAVGILLRQSLIFFGWMHFCAGVGGLLVAFALVLPVVKPQPRLHGIAPFLRASLPFAASNIFFVIYGQVDTVMLANMREATEVGIYSAAFRVVGLTSILPVAYSAALLPAAFGLGSSRTAELRRIFQNNARYLAAAALPVALAVFLYATPIRVILMGDDYAGAELLMRILALQVLLRFISFAPADTLYAFGRERTRVVIQGSAALVNVLLNLLMIPLWGAVGAALATIITEAALLILMARVAAQVSGGLGLVRALLRPALAALPPAAFLLWLGPATVLAVALSALFAGAAYLGLLVLTGFFAPGELRRLLRRRVVSQGSAPD